MANKKETMMLNGTLTIMRLMYATLCRLSVDEAIRPVDEMDQETKERYQRKDGKDTLWLDVVAEEAICIGNLRRAGHYALFQYVYSESGVVITEERGRVPSDRVINNTTPVIISDPIDGSKLLRDLIRKYQKSCSTLGEVFEVARKDTSQSLVRVEAPNASVTLIKDNKIRYSVVLNLLTGEVFVAYEAGVFCGHINKVTSVDKLRKRVTFKDTESLEMLCYNKGSRYEANRVGTHLRSFPMAEGIPYPVGPLRFAYLLSNGREPLSNIGVIAHNGEKIQEALPNIAVAFFSDGALQAFKLFCDREYHRERAEKLMTPVLLNSLYSNGLLSNTGISAAHLNHHAYPSQFRDTTVIVPSNNDPAISMMKGMVQDRFAIRII